MDTIRIDADFESGNVGEVRIQEPNIVEFNIRIDAHSEHYQWFYFRIQGAAGKTIRFRAINAGGAAYADGWKFHRPVISPDAKSWTHINDTDYDGEVYSFTTTIESDTAYIAYHHPLTTADLEAFLATTDGHPAVERKVLTQSLKGRPVHWLTIADPEAFGPVNHSVWVIGRQHPGEPQGTNSATGLISFLLSDDPLATRLRKSCVFQIVPDINPDGVALGHHRTNAKGVNLNRAWEENNPLTAPTIFAFQEQVRVWKAADRPIDFFFDMHADEIQRSNVVYGMAAEVTDEAYQERQMQILKLWEKECPDFSVAESTYYTGLDTRLAKQWMFVEGGAVSFTYEMTYHDVPYSPHGDQYITPERTFELGHALGRALARCLG